jgi:HEAT repeat protein
MELLRRALDADQGRAIAAVDRLAASATDLDAKKYAMRAMTVLAEGQDPAIDDALNRYTEAGSGLLRVHAAKLLQGRGDASALASVASDLATKLEATDDVQRKVQMLGLLQWAGDPGSASKILPVLHDPSGAVRQRAVLALGQFEDASVRTALTSMLGDSDPGVQQAAQSVLRRTP